MTYCLTMSMLGVAAFLLAASAAAAAADLMLTEASWYGEDHRGRLMANGTPFNPDALTCASWFYPLGTRLRVSVAGYRGRSVTVTVTDRGPARRLVAAGRAIDLSMAAFRRLHPLRHGLVRVRVERIP